MKKIWVRAELCELSIEKTLGGKYGSPMEIFITSNPEKYTIAEWNDAMGTVGAEPPKGIRS